MQLRHYVELQEELAINYCKLAVVSVDSPEVNAAFEPVWAQSSHSSAIKIAKSFNSWI